MGWPRINPDNTFAHEIIWNSIPDPVLDSFAWETLGARVLAETQRRVNQRETRRRHNEVTKVPWVTRDTT